MRLFKKPAWWCRQIGIEYCGCGKGGWTVYLWNWILQIGRCECCDE